MSVVIGMLLRSPAWYNEVKQHQPRFVLGLVIVLACHVSVDSPADET